MKQAFFPLCGIGRSATGILTLGIVDTPEDFFCDVVGGVIIDVYAIQETIRKMRIQMDAAAPFKAPIAVNELFAVTYAEAEEVLFFLEDPGNYHSKADLFM